MIIIQAIYKIKQNKTKQNKTENQNPIQKQNINLCGLG
jgi:hypothetical protein